MENQKQLSCRISDKRFWYQINQEFDKQGGVYCLYSQVENKTTPINRMLGTDNDGFLYIGKASVFLERVIDLKKSLSPDHNSSGHDAGVRWKKNKGIMKAFPFKCLIVKLIQSENPEKLETGLLKKYENDFGELPPLNRMS